MRSMQKNGSCRLPVMQVRGLFLGGFGWIDLSRQ